MATPQQLSDEELDAAIEEMLADPPVEEEEEPKKPETPPAPKEEAEAEEEEDKGKKKEAPVEEEEEGKKTEEPKKPEGEPSRREQLRIEKLLTKYPDLQTQVQPPAKKEEEPAAPNADGLLDLDKELDADDELKARLKADREAYAKQAVEKARAEGISVEQQLATNLFRTRLEIDAPRVEAKYPFLDKNSDEFNPRAASAMNLKYLQHVGFDQKTKTVQDPNTRYTDFVEAEMEFAREVAAREVSKTADEVKKQAAQTGLRPGGGSPKPKLNLNKLPHQMTDEELDAAIAQGLSS